MYEKAGCGHACFIGYFEATRNEELLIDESDETLRLANGIKGYYEARSCGVSCTPPSITWVRNGVLYSIQFNVNNKSKTRDKAELVALANSAILAGPR